MDTIIGANALIAWKYEDKLERVYFSFGTFNEITGMDEYLVCDETIFFFCSEAELREMAKRTSKEDFIVRDYELVRYGDRA